MAIVDTSLHPEPTGAAAALAEAHAQPHALKLYGGWFCPYVQRAWITLVEKSIPHQYIEINPYHKDASFLALNPRGLVPTLTVPVEEGEGKALYESTVVCEYLDEQFDGEQFGERLLSGTPYERARARLWIDHITTKIIPGFYKLLQHTPDKAYSLEDARAELHRNIRSFAAEMATDGPWFQGHKFSMVDVMLAPWAKRFWLIDYYKTGGTGIPKRGGEGDPGDETWDRWNTWFDAIVERPSVKATWSADERYILSYKRYAEDTTNSEVAQATREGKRLP